jgi:hypothetical protein
MACNPLSGADDEAEEIAATVAESIANAGQEAVDALEESKSAESDSEVAESIAPEESTSEEAVQSTSAEQDSEEPASSEGDKSPEAIADALRASLTIDAMRIRIISEDLTNDTTTEVTLAFIQPDRYQLSSEGTEIIVIGDTTYLGTPDGQWTETPVDMTDMVEQTLASFVSQDAIDERLANVDDNWSNVRTIGREEVNGVETIGYEYNETAVAQFSGLVRMWIGVDDGLLYRQEIESKVGDLQTRTLMEFEYGDDVTIEPPV